MQDQTGLPPEVINALWAGKKIDAIKLLREQHNIGLKEAKDMVDQYIASDPALNHQLQQSGNRGCLAWIIIIVLCAIGWYYLVNK